MNRIKLCAAALVLCLTGAVYAASDNARRGAKPAAAHKESCCAAGAGCCDGGSCCAAAHKGREGWDARASQDAEQGAEGESCCQAGASCCKSGGACCAAHKSGGKQAVAQSGKKGGAKPGCCAGDSCDASRKH